MRVFLAEDSFLLFKEGDGVFNTALLALLVTTLGGDIRDGELVAGETGVGGRLKLGLESFVACKVEGSSEFI